eukprot:TRINITY_DN4443_c0_g1_i1.p1 TRINITY_DN4443_c0_g1~~TRINITY_DN4443_c0_g1_i1.p1  ORF type:complete len:478 (+),score=130.32 TRINITY_DN4443_c0_g1_i1:20-1453(+)
MSSQNQYFEQLFNLADQDKDGVISPSDAAFLRKSGLELSVLSQIWGLVCTENRPLSRSQFYTALKLVAMAQNGQSLSLISADSFQALPVFEGIKTPVVSSPRSVESEWVISSDMRNAYYGFFTKLDTDGDGFVTGGEAQAFFVKSNVANNVLAQIWAMSDLDKDNRLDFNEFCVAIYLVQAAQAGRTIPTQLPMELKESAFGRSGSSTPRSGDDILASLVDLPSLKQKTVVTNVKPEKPKTSNPGIWVITPKEKATFTKTYLSLDKNNDGYISTFEAKDTFMMSQLQKADLAKIVSLVDFDKDGKLNKLEFFLAMKLIIQRRKGTPVPDTIPDELLEAVGLESLTNSSRESMKSIPKELISNVEGLRAEFHNLTERNKSLSADLEVSLRHRDNLGEALRGIQQENQYHEKEIRLQESKIRNLEEKILQSEGQLLEISAALGENGDPTQELRRKVQIAQSRLDELEDKISKARSQLDQ